MVPTSSRDSPVDLMSTKDRHKLRKPVVEKMRRDRINSCIEQLKVLLEKEFRRRDPNAKLEKADVLEMTVVFLKQQLQPHMALGHGYSHCWKEALHFQSFSSSPMKELQHLKPAAHREGPPPSIQAPAGKHQTSRVLWRPW
ncbi:transcription factor HES-5-like [Pholidichthys leucotaenia]